MLDPFMGSGSTAVAAVRADRRFVGYEVEPSYVSFCMERVSRIITDRSPPRKLLQLSPVSGGF